MNAAGTTPASAKVFGSTRNSAAACWFWMLEYDLWMMVYNICLDFLIANQSTAKL